MKMLFILTKKKTNTNFVFYFKFTDAKLNLENKKSTKCEINSYSNRKKNFGVKVKEPDSQHSMFTILHFLVFFSTYEF